MLRIGVAYGLLKSLTVDGVIDRDVDDMLVKAIRREPELKAALDLIPYAPDVHTADTGDAPGPTTTAVTGDPVIQPPGVVQNLSLVAERRVADGSATMAYVASWRPPLTGFAAAYEVYLDQGAGYALADVVQSLTTVVGSGIDPKTLPQVKVLGVSGSGRKLPLAEAVAVAIDLDDKAPLPTPVDRVAVTRLPEGSLSVTWTWSGVQADLAGFKLRAGLGAAQSWTSARPLHEGLVAGPPVPIADLGFSNAVLVKAVDLSGRESAVAAVALVQADQSVTDRVTLATFDEHADGFTGDKYGAVLDAGELVAGDPSSAMWTS